MKAHEKVEMDKHFAESLNKMAYALGYVRGVIRRKLQVDPEDASLKMALDEIDKVVPSRGGVP